MYAAINHALVRVHNLGRGWTLDPSGGPNDRDAYDWTVLAPDGKNSASLAFAMECGTTSCDDEIKIPASVMKVLDDLETKLIDAGLF